MTTRAEPLDALLEQWRLLSRRDRKAIRNHMPVEQRLALERALAERRIYSALPGQQDGHSPYSPWLAAILDAIGTPDRPAGDDATLPRAAVRHALHQAHARSKEKVRPDRRPSLLDLARSLVFEGSNRK